MNKTGWRLWYSFEETGDGFCRLLFWIVKLMGETKETGKHHPVIRTVDETRVVTSVEDTISYTNLVAGATYTVTGTLVEVDDDGKVIGEIATNTLDLVAETENGEWTMNFDNVTLNAYSRYVVFESAYTKNGEDENATEENPITHENVKDSAQTILTEDENGKIREFNEEGGSEDKKQGDKKYNDEKINDDSNTDSQGSGRKGTGGPSTGDSSNMALYITAAAAAAGIAITTVALGAKKRGSKR